MSRLGDRALGVTLAVGAWAFAVATYPLALAYAYGIREAAAAFDASMIELRESWESRQERAS